MRLFFAITFPDRIKTALADISQRLQAQLPSGHWTRRENYHLTLVFLGEMTPTQASAAKTVLHTQVFTAFELNFGAPGRFRKGNRDIWWMGIAQSGELARLHDALFTALTQAGFKLESRPYRPHLTLAREVKTPPGLSVSSGANRAQTLNLPVEAIPSETIPSETICVEAIPTEAIPVEAVSLMESVRVDGRLVYREIDRQPARRNQGATAISRRGTR